MLGYVMVGTNDLEKALAFYDGLMPILGGKRSMPFPKGQSYVFGDKPGPMFVVGTPYDGEAGSAGNGTMFAFRVPTTEAVSEAHPRRLNSVARAKVSRAHAAALATLPISAILTATSSPFSNSHKVDQSASSID